MIELEIVKTAKSYNSKDQFRTYDTEKKQFDTIDDAKKWIDTEYGKSKRSKIFIDKIDPKVFSGKISISVGYVIGFKNYDFDQDNSNKKVHFLEQHWISFYKKELLEI